MKRKPLPILLLILIFSYSLAGLADYFQDIYHSKKQIKNLEQLIQTEDKVSSDFAESTFQLMYDNENYPGHQMQTEFIKLYQQNPDIIGWLTIKNTNINYPVMQDPSGSDFYLDHNFEKQPSLHGLPFLDTRCNILNSNALLIHGHNMKTGLIFGDLMNYKKESYYKAHPRILFHTLYEKADYEIIDVILSKVYEKTDEAFRYYQLDPLQTPEGFQSYMYEIKKLALYQTGKTATFGDKILILSTCEYSAANGRLAVIARKIT
jgi:sortase B